MIHLLIIMINLCFNSHLPIAIIPVDSSSSRSESVDRMMVRLKVQN